jgi:DtxR family transcriptional regulator, Mn-dependent transcriptional regulator
MNWLVRLGRAVVAGSAGRSRDRSRERIEDALKWLHECEWTGRPATAAGLAERLDLSSSDGARIARELVRAGHASGDASGLSLTEGGRTYARRVVRTHRLWERYLADRTGLPASEWHAEAERVEHELTAAEADRLAGRLGDPRYDPHGDPIPTAGGEVPMARGVALSRVRAVGSVVITHVEDEPREVFDRLVAAGLVPGLAIEVTAVPDPVWADRPIGLRVRGVDWALSPSDAANVTVERLPTGEAVPGRRRTLGDVPLGEVARVVGIAPACQGPQRRRLLDLGVVPGTRIVPELVSASGDPVAYRIRGAVIALRGEQASWIEVELGGAGDP